MLRDYADAVELVTPLAVPPVVAADAHDDQVIAAAVAAEADILVSGDQHVLSVRHGKTRFITPTEAIRVIGGA